MTISVIIPTLNEEATINAVLTRTAPLGFEELIVVDGGSRDGTAGIVASHVHRTQPPVVTPIRFIQAQRGRARQMNEGVKTSRGETLLFLHADTLLPTTAKQDIDEAMQNSQVVGGRFNVEFDRPSGWSRIISRMMNWRSRWSGIATGDQAIFVRRRVFEQMGGFRDLPLMEDIDLSRRLKRMGKTVPLHSRVVTSYRRWEAHGPVRTILLMWILRFLYWAGVSPHRLAHLYAAVRDTGSGYRARGERDR